MRLKEIYSICASNHPVISNSLNLIVSINGSSDSSLNQWESTLDALLDLKRISFMKESIDHIFNAIPQATEHNSSIRITSNQKNIFIKELNTLCAKTSTIIELCEFMDMVEVSEGFEVKFPVFSDFNEFSKIINDFNQFLKMCPIFHQDDVSLQLKCTDVGSFWLIVGIVSSSAMIVLANLAKIVDAALTIRSHLVSIEQQKEALRAMKGKNDLMDEITKTYKDALTAVANAEAEKINAEIGDQSTSDPTALSKSIETLGNLLSRGVEIYASIDSAPEIKAVFPTVSQQHLPDSNPPRLTPNTENSNKE